ncbi:hypothetical protein TNCT_372801 [Trichonephila clavata]|uniref:Uncharacterized protein n=1 Tax=Trichonephila clavata TaxID=2740835 RepID=A0A8X6KF34_TRICU|nr:hypothetical protein TNCT_372801 [Trichonephila clavata]
MPIQELHLLIKGMEDSIRAVCMPEVPPSALASQDLLRVHSILLNLVCGAHSNLLPKNLGHGMSQV